MALVYFQTSNKDLTLLQSNWKSQLDPILANPVTNLQILKNIILSPGNNVINHKLGAIQQGYIIVDQQNPAIIYRTAPFNSLTLTLNSSIAATISLGVF